MVILLSNWDYHLIKFHSILNKRSISHKSKFHTELKFAKLNLLWKISFLNTLFICRLQELEPSYSLSRNLQKIFVFTGLGRDGFEIRTKLTN